MHLTIRLFFLLVLLPALGSTQELPDSISQKIDRIFSQFTPFTPGAAIAIMQNGKVVFEKGYGRASLEYNAAIEPKTIFHIASESKQFVAFSILLLQQEGKLNVSDDIRQYLSFVPDFGHKITINHLIHHTSGLRDQWQLLANAGWQLDDVITQEQVLKLVSRQKALNFIPGEEYMYCNTGYTLLAEIVKQVSGQSLRQFTRERIFEPLGMRNSFFYDDYEEVVPGRAYSYYRNNKGYSKAVLSYSIVGATSLFTTVQDEMRWLRNFETGQVGGKELIEKMYQTGVLNNGNTLSYAYALNIGKYLGYQQIGHGGADAGYRSYACRFPETGLSIAIFSNLGSVSPNYLANRVAALFLTPIVQQPAKQSGQFAPESFHRLLAGDYYSHRGIPGKLRWQNGKLINTANGMSSEYKFLASQNNRYLLSDSSATLIILRDKPGDSIQEFELETKTASIKFYRQPAKPQQITAAFAGRYCNDETEACYTITEKNGQLLLTHRKFQDVPLTWFGPDQFTSPHWWMNHIRFLRKKGRIIGFEVNGGRILHLLYTKQKE